MRHLYRIILLCGLLIMSDRGLLKGQNTGIKPPATYTISAGSTITLHAATSNAAAYQWYKESAPIPGAVKQDYTTGIAGNYAVTAFNIDGCPSDKSDDVTVIVTAPVIIPDTSVDLMIQIQSSNIKAAPGQGYNYIITAGNNSAFNGTQVQVSYVLPPQVAYVPQGSTTGSGTVTYNAATRTLTWEMDILSQTSTKTLVVPVIVLQPGVIESVVNIKGLQPDPNLANNTAQAVQQVNPLIIPNVFTPNGDGVNDTFVIPGLDTYSENEITIINRWGNDVYEKKNYQNDWTGNGLLEGTYFYVLRVFTLGGQWDVYKGYVTLLRKKSE
jgi:gliding motility-associated-like protein/uncharacterized repeat protein (TIGR01451 family)